MVTLEKGHLCEFRRKGKFKYLPVCFPKTPSTCTVQWSNMNVSHHPLYQGEGDKDKQEHPYENIKGEHETQIQSKQERGVAGRGEIKSGFMDKNKTGYIRWRS